MYFFMSLNDSFSQVRGQLLLLDPIPPINKVFSLVSQEERQRTISSHVTSGNPDYVNRMVFTICNDAGKKSSNDTSNSGGNRY